MASERETWWKDCTNPARMLDDRAYHGTPHQAMCAIYNMAKHCHKQGELATACLAVVRQTLADVIFDPIGCAAFSRAAERAGVDTATIRAMCAVGHSSWSRAREVYYASVHYRDHAKAGKKEIAGWTCHMIRELFPYWTDHVQLPGWKRWAAPGTAPYLMVRRIYLEDNMAACPILTDLLEDRDCEDYEVIKALRSPGTHLVGWWPAECVYMGGVPCVHT